MKATDLKKNEVILCVTVEECLAIEKLMHKSGLCWCTGSSYIERSVSLDFIGEHCYYPKYGSHAILDYFEGRKASIYPASLFLENTSYEIY